MSKSTTATPLVAIKNPLDEENRHPKAASTLAAVATTALLPAWAFTLLPMSIFYQTCRLAIKKLSNMEQDETLKLDSGYVVDSSTVTPRSERKYDIVVLGATGFAGRLAARHLAKTYGVSGGGGDSGTTTDDVKWAIAGRSRAKLDKVKDELAIELGMPEIRQKVDAIVVDTAVPSTLPQLVEQTRVVATTAGPYGLYGSSVVEFCAKFGTHYVDITGEVDWVRTMVDQWQGIAQKTGAKLISFCGNDSIPWDLSTMKLRNVLHQECDGEHLAKVTFWDEIQAEASGGTMATIVSNVDGTGFKPPKFTTDPFLRKPDGSLSTNAATSDLPAFISKSTSPWDDSQCRRWTAPFVMAAVNAEVVKWSHALRGHEQSTSAAPSFSYRESLLLPDWKTAFVNYFGGIMFATALFNPLTLALMKRTVLPKPGQGPSAENMENKNFLCVLGEGIGAKGSRVQSVLYFPKDPGYMETSRMLVESGLCLALQQDKLPNNSQAGGFWTPSTGLGNVLIDRLIRSGNTTMECKVVVSSSSSSSISKKE